ncbi:hypothetical protein JS530_08700 [Bifidobacterium sp. LC6]|uniref:Uncharacterized protein n=1 Tax=Bifidobacterium colobi TaxID=2809026 RepID=A0ABS5UWU2_9BIFI|nr:hypothetical protein [Bifidobacterium colobi]MBT1175572.1 hypothetical protein [Bifidobacterium colobi]
MSPCETALTTANAASSLPKGTPELHYYLTELAAPLAWIDVAGQCTDRFAEGVLRNAQSKTVVTLLADKYGQTAPEVTPARLDGVTTATVSVSTLDAMAVAEDRAGFAIEVLAARGQTAGATLELSDMHKAAAGQLVSLADAVHDSASDGTGDGSATQQSSSHTDPRQKVYAIDTLLANPATIMDKASGQQVPTAAAIEMDCARAEIKAVSASKSKPSTNTALILAALAAKHAFNAIALGYPSSDAALFV